MKIFVLVLCASLHLGSADSSDSINFISIGCYYPGAAPRAIPSLEGQDPRLDGGNYKTRKDAIEKCASVAKQRGYKVFALQDGGMCSSSSTAHMTFQTYGWSSQCKSDGRGGRIANHVYAVGGIKDLYSAIEYKSLGCYKYNMEMTVLEGTDLDVLDGDYKLRTDAIAKCALAALKIGYIIFAIHDGGSCLISGLHPPTFNKFGISQDCKSDGKGAPGAHHVYVTGGIQALADRTESGIRRGCYKDLPVRAMEILEGKDHLLDGNYTTRKNAIEKCLLVGRGRGYPIVGIEDGGMCVGSPTLKDFNKYGISRDCKSDGKGGPWATEVHAFTSMEDFLSSVKYESLGCYRDKRAGAIPSMETTDALLKDDYSLRNHAIQKCAVAALTRGYKMFAIQGGGLCVGSPNAHKVYGKYGKSQDCKNDGKGGVGANHVYNLTGTMEDILSPFIHMYYDDQKLGCFKDSQARDIPSLEGQDPVLDGDYTTRQDAARKCALAAKKREHKVYVFMSDGQCSSGADTAKSFAKFGHGETECSAMGANNKVYNSEYNSVDVLLPYMEYESVGCFKDSDIGRVDGYHNNFPSATLLDNDYKTRQQAIQKCAVFAKLQGYKMFGIQDGGMCVTSVSAHKTYNKYGESKDCKSDGKGGPWANQVYRFPERKDSSDSVNFTSIGCFHAWSSRAIPSLYGQDPHLDKTNYKWRKDAIEKCASVAEQRGYKVFALQDGGMCLSSSTMHKTFQTYGRSSQCKSDGRGGKEANQVYVIGGIKVLLPYMEYECVGCFKDSNERAIESVDGKNHHNFPSPSLLSNDYKTRQQAIQKCAVFAMLQGYKMFGIQDGGMCVTSPTAHKTYNKYGESQECKSDGKGGLLANQVYRFPGRKDSFDAVNITSIGCYRDLEDYPAIPRLEGQDLRLDGANYKGRTDAIEKCAFVAKQRGNKVFALQDGGMCLSSSTAHMTFQAYGSSSRCKSDGRGGKEANYVYVIGGIKDLYSAIEYKSLGCYKYKPQNSGLASLEGKDVLDGNYKLRTDAIEKCALAAMKTQKDVFAIQDGGKCLVSSTRDPAFNKYGISQDCKSDGKGASKASHVYLTFGIEALTDRTESGIRRGCYKDLPVRAMEILERKDHFLDGNYTTRKDALRKCILVGKGRGYPIVGIQNGDMCVGSPTLRDFNKYGVSHDCKSDGKGGPWATEVHALTWIEDFLSSVKYESLGCYKDKDNGVRAIPSMERRDVLLKDSYPQRNQAIQKCAVAALTRGYKMFAIQDGGMCVGSPNAHKVYGKYGKSQDCKNDGKGGAGANQVYNLTGTMEDILSPFSYYDLRRLGCFHDSQARAIPSLEGQDPVLDGDHTTRRDAVRKCALAAKKREHKVYVVMPNGQCSSGADTAKNFARFGHGENGCSAMKDIHRVYNYDYDSVDVLLPYMEYESVGCFKDSSERAIESVEGFHRYFPSVSLLFYDYKTRQQAIQKCAVFAKLKGYKMFGIQDGGFCVTSASAHETYNKYGESKDCKSDGKGGPWANQVYRFPERKE